MDAEPAEPVIEPVITFVTVSPVNEGDAVVLKS